MSKHLFFYVSMRFFHFPRELYIKHCALQVNPTMGKVLKNSSILKGIRHRVNLHRQWRKILANESNESQINLQENVNGTSSYQQQMRNEPQIVHSERERIQTTEEKLRCWVFKHLAIAGFLQTTIKL